MAKKFFQHHFQRFETKYIISKETLLALSLEFEGYLLEDERAYSTINNLYYDTSSYQLIRESLENPHFDEKVRLRTYQEHPTEDSQVFLEIKKLLSSRQRFSWFEEVKDNRIKLYCQIVEISMVESTSRS